MGTIPGELGWEANQINLRRIGIEEPFRLCPPTLVTFRSLGGSEKDIVDCLASITHGLWVMCSFTG